MKAAWRRSQIRVARSSAHESYVVERMRYFDVGWCWRFRSGPHRFFPNMLVIGSQTARYIHIHSHSPAHAAHPIASATVADSGAVKTATWGLMGTADLDLT